MDDRETLGLQAYTHWFIIDEQWMAEKPGLQAFTHFITGAMDGRETRLASFHTLAYYR